MARPRFHKLDATQQQQILDAALREFAGNGFGGASLNRIIEEAGISKGSMYYYFDGKEDLYAHVVRDQVERLIQDAGPIPVPETTDPDAFWEELTTAYLRLMRALLARPQAAGLLRGWLNGGTPAMQEAQQDAERDVRPWMVRTVTAGQTIGAVRTDLPPELLIAVAFALGQVVDVWLITRTDDDDDPGDSVRTLMGMMRRALAP
jgi:AcrR family transcriptional regulator